MFGKVVVVAIVQNDVCRYDLLTIYLFTFIERASRLLSLFGDLSAMASDLTAKDVANVCRVCLYKGKDYAYASLTSEPARGTFIRSTNIYVSVVVMLVTLISHIYGLQSVLS